MTRLIVGPFNRVEGDLEVRLDLADGAVRDAFVTAPLYRGFEQILVGRAPLDALTIAPRICGICSVSQSMAVVAALRSLAGMGPAANGQLAANLVHAAENLADHLTHSFVFFLPDFANPTYADRSWFPTARSFYAAGRGSRSATALRLRARLLHVVGLLAGKWPHSLALQPGGTTVGVDAGVKARLLSVLADVRRGLEDQVFAAPLERIASLDSISALSAYLTEEAPESADFRFFLSVADALDLNRLGRCGDRFLSLGAYEGTDGGHLFRPGLWEDGLTRPVLPASIVEDSTRAWMDDPAAHPTTGSNTPDPDKADAYTWCKAPRLDGRTVQVGAIARQVVAGQPLVTDLVAQDGGTVAGRIIARFVEMAQLVIAMDGWVRALKIHEPFCAEIPLPRDGTGVGLVEAARGSLGHWLSVRDGQLSSYQIIAPTTWNFSPRDAAGTPGPLEEALVGTPVAPGDTAPVAVQHVVRSFDPCMVCTVH